MLKYYAGHSDTRIVLLGHFGAIQITVLVTTVAATDDRNVLVKHPPTIVIKVKVVIR